MRPFRATVGPAIRVALVVGTILNLVNYGEVMMQALEPPWVQLGINYLVPYCVATYGAMKI